MDIQLKTIPANLPYVETIVDDITVGEVVYGIISKEDFKPSLFLRTFSEIVSLDNPNYTWLINREIKIKVFQRNVNTKIIAEIYEFLRS
jgi:hypothetical protein